MKIIDTHCDALFKMQVAKRDALYHAPLLDFRNSEKLDANFERLQEGDIELMNCKSILLNPKWKDLGAGIFWHTCRFDTGLCKANTPLFMSSACS
ncbi:hypothetical protein BB776_03300 [Planococcus salinarum]|uniref:Membrane dipeptidase n=1 Tax=Planococcus salinarum TaxID=622695 RepID=A0ABX3D1D4_9BACL|nr:hypothetical protein [Planococcus salinarum]OHX51336.1 hypothetical protein BB776_03300 [Planococcus salinarum]TAA73573.1 hypothetical protein D2909_01640 [Planococcus salinarum]